MTPDHYALLKRAVAGKDAAERTKVYDYASGIIRRSSHLTPEDASYHADALQDAIRRIEDEFAAADSKSAAVVRATLSPNRSRRPLVIAAAVTVAMAALPALLYLYAAGKGPTGPGATASSPRAPRGASDAVIADLRPGVDGGSTGDGLPFAFQRQVVFYRTTIVPGSIVVDRNNRFLYLIDSNNSARRYGIGIARECLQGGSLLHIVNKLEWPDWKTPEADKQAADELLPEAGHPGSSLGARALLLSKPGLLIHGTNSPKTIGHLVASGCIRMVNNDVEDLYRRVSLETRVVFVS
jgi:lipoprotein-anchoring transpeptidase ErfK/SrfK